MCIRDRLLENVRFYPEEEGKPILPETVTDEEKKVAKAEMKIRQKEMAKKLAGYAEIYVNDAFGTAHRAHATTAVMADFFENDKRMFGFLINSELVAMDKVLKDPQRPFTAIMGGAKVSDQIMADFFENDKRMFGFLINSELVAMDKVLKDPQRPFTAIMGGAKVSDKIMLIENLLNRVDNLIIGGGMTYTFIKAMGGKIGKSLCEEDKLDLALKLIEKAKEKHVKLYLPVDSLNADKFDNDANTKVSAVDAVEDGWMGLDIAEKTIKEFTSVIENSKTILWNGPMGVFEMEKFSKGTTAVAKAIAAATSKGCLL